MVAQKNVVSSETVEDSGQEGEEGGHVDVIPGMVKFYDTSSRLFGIRYSHGNR